MDGLSDDELRTRIFISQKFVAFGVIFLVVTFILVLNAQYHWDEYDDTGNDKHLEYQRLSLLLGTITFIVGGMFILIGSIELFMIYRHKRKRMSMSR